MLYSHLKFSLGEIPEHGHVILYRRIEYEYILLDHGNTFIQRLCLDIFKAFTVHKDIAVIIGSRSHQQIKQCGLAASAGTYYSISFTCVKFCGYAVKYLFLLIVAKAYVIKDYFIIYICDLFSTG